MRCAVRHCGNNNRNGNTKNWRYFHFPKDKKLLKKWIEFCERDIVNTTTACICNEHFAPEDFERNMQYELGFSRKNPTKLKPGSVPSIQTPQDKLLQNQATGKRCHVKEEQKKHIASSSQIEDDGEGESSSNSESISQQQTYEMIEYISDPEDYTNAELSEEASLHSNPEEHVEIIDSDPDSYTRHLEMEVSSLKREVFFLKDERKKLFEEIQNLKETVRNCRLKHEGLESVNGISNKVITRARHKAPPVKKTVVVYTADVETIQKLRRINKTTD